MLAGQQWDLTDELRGVQENSTSVSVYFPAAKWYSLYDYSVVDASSGGLTQSFEVGFCAVVVLLLTFSFRCRAAAAHAPVHC